MEMVNGIYDDLDNDGKKSTGDLFGYTVHHNVLDAFVIGSEIKAIEKDSSDLPILSNKYGSERMVDLMDKLTSWLNGSESVYMESGYNNPRAIFEDGRALFITDRVYITVNWISDMEDTYGLVPSPKYDENQKEYYTDVGHPHTMYSISNMMDDPDMGAAVIECLAVESYNQVIPEVFEVTMKSKYSSSEEAAKMYDLLRERITFDLGKVFYFEFSGNTNEIYKKNIGNNQPNWTSTYRSIRGSIQAALDKISKQLTD